VSDEKHYDHDRESADADVDSIQEGDTASDIESKLLGMTHISGNPSHDADDADEVPSA
jgi:hypothetical protein